MQKNAVFPRGPIFLRAFHVTSGPIPSGSPGVIAISREGARPAMAWASGPGRRQARGRLLARAVDEGVLSLAIEPEGDLMLILARVKVVSDLFLGFFEALVIGGLHVDELED